MNTAKVRKERTFSSAARRGFTLIELLTVVAIIGLLISILAPALSKARQQARNIVTRGALQSIGGGLEMFRNENQRDFRRTDGLPPSARAEDKASPGEQCIWGAQWLVRYLMGKDLHGYAPRRNVPRVLLAPDNVYEEEEWYNYNADGTPKVERVGPYLSSEAVRLAKPEQLPGFDLVPSVLPHADAETWKQPVILDAFGYPILYYVANPRQAAKPRAYVAGYDPECLTCIVGVFDFSDNGLFTGQCEDFGGVCKYPGWDFEAVGPHLIEFFGPTEFEDYKDDYAEWFVNGPDQIHTFQYYIMNKTLYDSTYDSNNPNNVPTLTPYRRDSYLLIAPGKDALYGTDDDVTNFE